MSQKSPRRKLTSNYGTFPNKIGLDLDWIQPSFFYLYSHREICLNNENKKRYTNAIHILSIGSFDNHPEVTLYFKWWETEGRVGLLHLQHCNDICGMQRVVSRVLLLLGIQVLFIAHKSDWSVFPVIVGSEDLVHSSALRTPDWQMLKKKVCRWLYVLNRFSSCVCYLKKEWNSI